MRVSKTCSNNSPMNSEQEKENAVGSMGFRFVPVSLVKFTFFSVSANTRQSRVDGRPVSVRHKRAAIFFFFHFCLFF